MGAGKVLHDDGLHAVDVGERGAPLLHHDDGLRGCATPFSTTSTTATSAVPRPPSPHVPAACCRSLQPNQLGAERQQAVQALRGPEGGRDHARRAADGQGASLASVGAVGGRKRRWGGGRPPSRAPTLARLAHTPGHLCRPQPPRDERRAVQDEHDGPAPEHALGLGLLPRRASARPGLHREPNLGAPRPLTPRGVVLCVCILWEATHASLSRSVSLAVSALSRGRRPVYGLGTMLYGLSLDSPPCICTNKRPKSDTPHILTSSPHLRHTYVSHESV